MLSSFLLGLVAEGLLGAYWTRPGGWLGSVHGYYGPQYAPYSAGYLAPTPYYPLPVYYPRPRPYYLPNYYQLPVYGPYPQLPYYY